MTVNASFEVFIFIRAKRKTDCYFYARICGKKAGGKLKKLDKNRKTGKISDGKNRKIFAGKNCWKK